MTTKLSQKKILSALALLAWFAAGGTRAAEPFYNESTVATTNGTSYVGYRQVGTVRAPNGALLTYFQGRYTAADTASKDLLISRSTDGGSTWTTPTVIFDRSFIEPLGTNYRWGNPCAVVDYVNNRIFLFAGSSFGISPNLYYRTSTDNGATWSGVSSINVDTLFSGISRPDHQPMPGHGIQLSSGRLVLPFLHKNGGFGVEQDFLIGVMYSDDAGANWQAGGVSSPSGTGNEWSVAQLSTGTLYMNSRNAAGTSRVEATSTNGGVTWSALATDVSLPENPQSGGTACGLIKLSGANDRMLFTTPDPAASTRIDLTVYSSTDNGGTWKRGPILRRGNSSYSDLVELADGKTYGVAVQGGASIETAILFGRFNWEQATSIEIDNGTNGYTEAGTWSSSTAKPGFYGADYRHDGDGVANPSESARWTPTIATAGPYRVFVNWTSDTSRPDAAPVIVRHNGGSTTSSFVVNQQSGAATLDWREIGVFQFNTGTGNWVEVSAADTGYTAADAARFVPVPATLFDDFEDGSATDWTTTNGSWSVVTSGNLVYQVVSGASINAYSVRGTSAANYAVEADMQLTSSAAQAGILARYIDINNWLTLRLHKPTNRVQIGKYVAGVWTLLAETPLTINLNQWYGLKLVVNGTTLSGYVDDFTTPLLTVTDGSLASGRPGLRVRDGSAQFDNIVVHVP